MASESTLRWVEFWQRVSKDAPGREVTAEEMADILWLAGKLDAPAPRAGGAGDEQRLSAVVDRPPPLPPAAPRALPPASQPGSRPGSISVTETLPGAAAADLYPRRAGEDEGGAGGVRAVPVRSPAGRALPGALAMARALRPLKKRIPSARDLVLDEIATAERIAHTNEWVPVLRPAPERWLTLTLVVDEAPSMLVWERFAAALQAMLARLGAFRDIEVWGVASSAGGAEITVRRGFGPGADPNPRSPAEIADQQGRNLILLASDCRSPAWYSGAMSRLLAAWGAKQPVAILQVLPRRLWAQTALQQHVGIFVRSPLPGGVNRKLEVRWASPEDEEYYRHGVPVPVLLPDPSWLNLWARALAGNSRLWVPGVMLIDYDWRGENPALQEAGQAVGPAQAAALLRRFQGSASPSARRLAAYFTAVPLTLPVMRLVQAALAPDSTPMHLAEVFLSGLLRPLPPQQPQPGEEQREPEFEFIAPEVPQLLANSLAVDELRRVLEAISRYSGPRFGQPLDFGALLADPTAAGPLALDEQNKPFARVAAPILDRFGGEYARLARRLQGALGERVIERPLTVEEQGAPAAGAGRERPAHAGTLRALVVGIDRYADRSLPESLGSARDAQNVARALERYCGLEPSNLTTLHDEAATRAAVRAALDGLAQVAQEGDTLLFYFAGLSSRLPTRVQAPDGFDEALAPYDHTAAGGDTAIAHADLVQFAVAAGRAGARAALVLDTSYAGGGAFVQAAPDNLIVLAACREDEEGNTLPGPEAEGAYTRHFCAALTGFHPGMTWAELHEVVLANLHAAGVSQHPQLIGDGSRVLFGAGAHQPTEPYLLVVDAARDNTAVTINASAPLNLEPGTVLSVYPPGSLLDDTRAQAATLVAVGDFTATARLEAQYSAVLGSRARVVTPAPEDRLRVAWDSAFGGTLLASGFLEGAGPDDADALHVRAAGDDWQVETGDGIVLLAGPRPPDPLDAAAAVFPALEHLARFRLAWRARNGAGGDTAFSDVLEMALLARDAAAGLAGGSTVSAGQAMILRLTNRSPTPLHVSLWQFSETLRVERFYPRSSDWLLLAPGATLSAAVTLSVNTSGGEREALALRAFAVSTPVALDLLRLPAPDAAVQVYWANLRAWLEAPSPAAPAAPERPARKGRARPAAKGEAQERVALKGGGVETRKLWQPGATVRIRFLDGDPAVRRRVAEVAQEWTRYANIRFEFGDEPGAEVRVAFQPGAGSWSYVGMDALAVAKDQPTMNLGWINAGTSETELRRVVLHEFGHVLGLVCEATYNTTIPWDRDKVTAHFSRPPNNWSREQIEAQFFRTPPDEYPPAGLLMKEFDPRSIMLWPITKDLTVGGFETPLNTELSALDREFIAGVYPYTSTGDAPQTAA